MSIDTDTINNNTSAAERREAFVSDEINKKPCGGCTAGGNDSSEEMCPARDHNGDRLINCFLNLGEIMLRAGAEVNRVEDTICRIGHAYGFERVEIFTINNMISLTVISPDGRVYSQTRRVSVASVDLEKVARANELSRQICRNPIPMEDLARAICDIASNTKHYGKRMRYIASAMSATAFTIFFGGNWIEAIISGAVSIILVTIMIFEERLKIRPIIAILVGSFFMTMCVEGVTFFVPGAARDSIIIGNIMLLIPGLNLTTSIRDVITGDTVAGLMGICDALLKAFAIAVGCVSAMMIFK